MQSTCPPWTESIRRRSGPREPALPMSTARPSRNRCSERRRSGSSPSAFGSCGRRTSPRPPRTKLHKPLANIKGPRRNAMLKECRSHGYFREEFCPHCGSEGKFLLNDEEVELLGRTMAGVLRHFPQRYGLEMDAHGWVDLRDFLTAVQIRNRRFRFLRQHHVVGLIETDPKG